MVEGGVDASIVAGGEQVEQAATQHRQREGASGHAVDAVALRWGLVRVQDFEPVVDGAGREAGPRLVGLDQRPSAIAVRSVGAPRPPGDGRPQTFNRERAATATAERTASRCVRTVRRTSPGTLTGTGVPGRVIRR